jgi:hypothetical protein
MNIMSPGQYFLKILIMIVRYDRTKVYLSLIWDNNSKNLEMAKSKQLYTTFCQNLIIDIFYQLLYQFKDCKTMTVLYLIIYIKIIKKYWDVDLLPKKFFLFFFVYLLLLFYLIIDVWVNMYYSVIYTYFINKISIYPLKFNQDIVLSLRWYFIFSKSNAYKVSSKCYCQNILVVFFQWLSKFDQLGIVNFLDTIFCLWYFKIFFNIL